MSDLFRYRVMHDNPLLQAGLEPHPGWFLRQFLGRGGFGEVWKAELPNGRMLALKFMQAAKTANRATPQEIHSTQMIRPLNHAHLIPIEKVWIFQNFIVIAMELAEGSLDDLLQAYLAEFGKPIPPQQLCLYLTQAATALDFLNSRQHRFRSQVIAIQHCDIKPGNLLLFEDVVKISDFGLATALTGLSKTHGRTGTEGYAAPEVSQGLLCERTDQYALAASYCYLRTGHLPFRAPRHSHSSRAPSSPDLTALPPSERAILARALDRVPQQRWPSCGEMMAQLFRVVS